MATRTFPDIIGTLDRGVRVLWGTLTIGATGAITAQDCLGFSVSRLGVGNYRIQLEDAWPISPARYVSNSATTNPVYSVTATIQDAGTRVFRMMTVTAIDLTNNRVDIIFDSAANTPGELTNGCTLRLEVTLHNSSSPRKGG